MFSKYFRFKDPTISGKWKEILKDKYGTSGFSINRCSSFWSGILSIKHIVELGINRSVGNDNCTHFWLDRWASESPLYCIYPNLFQISSDPLISVSNVFRNPPHISLEFTRQLTSIKLREWTWR